MPQINDIVVKAANNTTDVTFAAVVPSAGDKSPARWQETAASSYRGHRPTLEVQAQFNGPRTARRITGRLTVPMVAMESGKEAMVGQMIGDFTCVIPTSVSDAQANEFAARFGNLLASTLMKQCVAVTYAAT